MSRRNFKVAACTFSVGGSKEGNIAVAEQLIDEAAEEWGVKMVCFPQLFLSGVPDRSITKPNLMRVAEPIPGPFSEVLAEKAKQHEIYIIGGSIVELEGDGVIYDTCCLVGPDGKIVAKVSAAYDMLNTAIKHKAGAGFSLAPEETGPRVFDTPLGKVGVVVGEDRSISKVKEKIKRGKPDVVFVVNNVSARTTPSILRELSETYASDFLCYVAFSNANGLRRHVRDFGDIFYNGNSAIINPGGQVIARTTVSTLRPFESMAVAMIDLKLLDKVRVNSSNHDAVAIPW
jgi:predicted amidohydrolase